jgi:hypothetical protein
VARSPIKKKVEEDDSVSKIEAPSELSDNSCYSTPVGSRSKAKKESMIERVIRKQKTMKNSNEQVANHDKELRLTIEKEDMGNLYKIIERIICNTGRIQERLTKYVEKDPVINEMNRKNMKSVKEIITWYNSLYNNKERCGDGDHTMANCNKEPCCAMCKAQNLENRRHVTGSLTCPIYRKAMKEGLTTIRN